MRYYNIPVFVPHYGCPFDCVFCNQKHITGEKREVTGTVVREIIEEHLKTIEAVEERRVEVAFFGGSFTAIDVEKQVELLESAYEYVKNGRVSGIRLSTRPDYINDEILKRLVSYGVTAVELGVQSMDDEVLMLSGRGHKSEVVEAAVEVIKRYPVELGLQMMTGLPGDTYEKSMLTCRKIISLKPDCVRIYPTLVIKDTGLERLYESGRYMPQSLEEAVALASDLMIEFRRNNIKVIRAGLAATEEISYGGALIAGPFHCAFGELAEGEVFYKKINSHMMDTEYKEFKINPKDMSKAVGNGKRNIKRLEAEGKRICLVADEKVCVGEIIPVKG